MSLSFEERLAAETAPRRKPCLACDVLESLTPEQREALQAASLKHASQLARVLAVSETTIKRHRTEGHDDLR